MFNKKIITRNKNGTKIIVIIQFTKNPKKHFDYKLLENHIYYKKKTLQ